jgi:hypothetical protein
MLLESQTALYAVVLVLLGAASKQPELIVVAVAFLVAMMGAKTAGFTSSTIDFFGFLVSAVIVGMILHHKKMHEIEKFQNTLTSDRNPDDPPNLDCGVFYVPTQYQESCKAGYFNKPSTMLKLRKEELDKKKNLTAAEQLEKTYVNDVLKARSSLTIPDNGRGCLLGLADMKSQKKFDFTDKATLDANNDKTAAGKPTNITKNWAFCWGERGSEAEAVQAAKTIGNKGTIYANEGYSTTFNNSASYYYKVNFDNFEYNNVKQSICAMPATSLVTNTDVFLGFDIDLNMKITKYAAYYIQNNTVKPYLAPNDLYRMLFDFVQPANTKDLYFRPKDIPTAQIYTISTDICDRTNSLTKRPLSFSLKSIRVGDKFIMKIPAELDLSMGLSGLDTKYNDLIAQYQALQSNLDALNTAKANADTTTYLYPGLIVKMYDLPSTLQRPGGFAGPLADNNTQMNDVFTNQVRNMRQRTTNDPNFETTPTELTAFEYIGYIDIPESDYYKFKISSDDAGQLFIGETTPSTSSDTLANVLVATHYGYHGMDANGISLDAPGTSSGTGFYLPAGKVKIYARMFEWRGGEGLKIYWKRANGNQTFTVVPTDRYSYNKGKMGFLYDAQISSTRSQMTNVETQMASLESFRQTLASSTVDYMIDLMNQCIGKTLSSVVTANDVSSGDRIYVFIGNPTNIFMPDTSATARQSLVDNLLDLSSQYRTLDPPLGIDFTKAPEYTISMWLNVQKPHKTWRNIIFHGESDDWTNWNSDEQGGVDRTPGMWIYPATGESWAPNDNKVRIHFRHRVNNNKDAFSFNWGSDLWNVADAPSYNQWFHYAVTVSASVMKMYVNGILINTYDLTNTGYNFEWNVKPKKKFFVGLYNQYRKTWNITNGPVYIQKVSWWNTALAPTDIANLAKEPIMATPAIQSSSAYPLSLSAPTTIKDLFNNVVVNSGVYSLKIGNFVYPVYVDVTADPNAGTSTKWLLILNYVHKGGTNPELFIRKSSDGFPIMKGAILGTDGSTDQETWGHLGKQFLTQVYDQCGGFSKMRFFGTMTGNKKIHFITSDTRVINYAKTGLGNMPNGFSTTAMQDQNSTLPKQQNSYFSNQGDYALTEFPFFKNGQTHWGIRGGVSWRSANRWEVDDFNNGYTKDTIHQVWIGV